MTKKKAEIIHFALHITKEELESLLPGRLLLEYLESKKLEEIILNARQALFAAKGNDTVNPFRYAENCCKANFTMAVLHTMVDDPEAAAEYAKQAYLYDHAIFSQHIYLIKMLLKVNDPECDKVAAQIATWDATVSSAIQDYEDTAREAIFILEAFKDRSKDIQLALLDIKLRRTLQPLQRAKNDSFEPAFDILEQMRKIGRPDDEVDALYTLVLESARRLDEIVAKWGDRCIGDIPFPLAYACITRQMIHEGIKLPDPIPLPKSNRADNWLAALASIVSEFKIGVTKQIAGRKQFVIEELSDQSKEKYDEFTRLALAFGQEGCNIYKRFLQGERNGSATSPGQCMHLLALHAETLAKLGREDEGFAMLEEAMEMHPNEHIAHAYVNLALDAEKTEKAEKGLAWIEEYELGKYGWQKRHAYDRLKLWLSGLRGVWKDYKANLNEYLEKYSILYHSFKYTHVEMLPKIADSYETEKVEFVMGCSSILQMIERYMENKDFGEEVNEDALKVFLQHKPILPNLIELPYRYDFLLSKIDSMKANLSKLDDPAKIRLCTALQTKAYLYYCESTTITDYKNSKAIITDEEKFKEFYELTLEAKKYFTASSSDNEIESAFLEFLYHKMLDEHEAAIDQLRTIIATVDYEEKKQFDQKLKHFPWKDNKLEKHLAHPVILAYAINTIIDIAKKTDVISNQDILLYCLLLEKTAPPFPKNWWNIALLYMEDAMNDDLFAYTHCRRYAFKYLHWLKRNDPHTPLSPLHIDILSQISSKAWSFRLANHYLKLLERTYPDYENIERVREKLEIEKKKFEETEEVYNEAMERKRKSEKFLIKKLIPVYKELPPIETGHRLSKRSYKEVEAIVVGTTAISTISQVATEAFVGKGDFEESAQIILKNGYENYFCNEMKAFFDLNQTLSDELSFERYRRLIHKIHPLLWVLKIIDVPEVPEKIFKADSILSHLQLYQIVEKNIIKAEPPENPELRSTSEILDKLDLIYRINYTIDKDRLESLSTGKPFQKNKYYNEGIIRIWHSALAWVLNIDMYNDWLWFDIDPLIGLEDEYEELRNKLQKDHE